jgi:tetratricopeptide (TPR) repeat protein
LFLERQSLVQPQTTTHVRANRLRLRALGHFLTGIPWWIGLALLAALLLLPDAMAGPLSTFWMRFPGLDKPTHFLAFIVVFLIVHAVLHRCEWPATEQRRLSAALAGSLIISLVDEAQQAVFGHGRTAEYGDLVADAAGALAGMTLLSATRLGLHRAIAIIGLLTVPVVAVTVQTYDKLVHFNRGMVYERAQNYEQARAEYLLALKSGFQSAHLYNTIAWLDIEFLEANPVEAEYYAAQALTVDPDNPDILDTYGWILVLKGQAREGLVFLERAKKLNPKIYCIDLHLGLAYRETGDRQRAAEYLHRQVERNPADRFGQSARKLLVEMETQSK